MELPHDTEEAKNMQLKLREKVKIVPLKKKPEFIAGVDAAFTEDKVIAAACLFKYPELIHMEDAYAALHITFPYIPGLLTFREGPAIMKAISRLSRKPDLVLFDGQGIAHPAGMGLAAHIGVMLNIPSIGCAKSRLVGDYTGPGNRKGQRAELRYHNKIIGTVLRTRDNVKPLFISPGHLIDMRDALEVVLTCVVKYRIPEPLRRADHLSKELKKTVRH
jgi:deoxyribonuclease V